MHDIMAGIQRLQGAGDKQQALVSELLSSASRPYTG